MKNKLASTFLIAVLLCTGVSPAQAAPKYSLSVTLGVNTAGVGDTKALALESCATRGLRKLSGTRLTVRSGSNKVLAAKEMGWKLGEVRQNFRPTDINDPLYVEGTVPGSEYFTVACYLQAKVKVSQSSFYQISIGSLSAGEYSFSELKSKKWRLVFSF
jgi:hypothetical protein